jgi:hypothetical protein
MAESLIDRKLPLWLLTPVAAAIIVGAWLLINWTPHIEVPATQSEQAAFDCTTADIAMGGFGAHFDYDYLTVEGTLTNGCDHPIRNVRLYFTMLNPDGSTEYGEAFLAAPLDAEIGAGASYQYQFVTRLGLGSAQSTYRVRPVEVLQ